MKAVAGPIPLGDNWAAEIKWDGMRLQAAISEENIRLWTGSGRVVTTSFPELFPMASALGVDAVIDGEAVVFDQGRPSFSRLQSRIHVTQPTTVLLSEYPVFFLAFDLLSLDGNSLLEVGFEDRHRLLASLVEDGPAWRVPAHSTDNPAALLALAEEKGLEGIVCKKRNSVYRPGQRSSDWVKVKIRKRQEFVVGGWLGGSGNLSGSLGSLLLGVYEGNDLIFAGAAGSGLSDNSRKDLLKRLQATEQPPFLVPPKPDRPVTWTTPITVVEVEFSLWPEGGQLWHPAFQGIRVDRDAKDVTREWLLN